MSSSGSVTLTVPTAVWFSATVKLSVMIAGDSLTSVRVTVIVFVTEFVPSLTVTSAV